MSIKNTQGISAIVLKPRAICYCPLGDDWYTNEFEVEFIPNDFFPDYCDIEKYLNENIRGKTLIIEDAVNMFFEYLKKEYNPTRLKVVSYVNDVTSHSPVIVIKE